MLLQQFLENSAERLPDKEALVCGEERLSFGQIERAANRLARLLAAQGVRRQDRVAILLDNSAVSAIALFGILKADAIFLMLGSTLKAPKLAYILNDCQAKALLTHPSKAAVVREALVAAPTVEFVLWTPTAPECSQDPAKGTPRNLGLFQALLSFDGSSPPTCRNIDLDLASIIYTSGSTGEPKGVMLTHLNMVSAATSITQYLENRPDDIILNVLPLSFDYGLYQVLMATQFGGTVVLERSFNYPYQVIQKMIQEKVTGFPCVPTNLAILLGLKNLDQFDFSSLRYITNTAAALPPAYIEKLRRIFPHVRIYSMYGLTECKRVSYLPPEEIDRRPTSVGRAMPNEEVWIVDEQGNPVGPGVVGELVVRGSNVMRGYWAKPEETARVLKPGKYPGELVLYTGDLFRMDEEGYLYFVARKGDMIKSRGARISPKEIEQCLCSMEGVAEAAVIGAPHEILGESIVAYVRPHDGIRLQAKEITAYCKTRLEDFMVPHEVRLIDSFPKTASGKIDKLALREFVLKGVAGPREPNARGEREGSLSAGPLVVQK